MIAPQSPGPLLRTLRVARRLTQEDVAQRAGISTRHLSCLEGGRARPTHAMLLVLGSALDLPLRERNTLLAAAGFAPVYRVSPFEDPAMVHVHQAVARILQLHEPHPAMLLDRSWNVLRLNDGAARLFTWCGLKLGVPDDPRLPPAGSASVAGGGATLNALRALFDPSYGLRERVVDFDALADAALARLRTEADVDSSLAGLLADLVHLRGAVARPRAPGPNAIALPIHLRHEGRDLRYFTTLTTLGTPLDVTAQELRIEGYFPLDDATDAFGRELARTTTC